MKEVQIQFFVCAPELLIKVEQCINLVSEDSKVLVVTLPLLLQTIIAEFRVGLS